jgi:flagellar biosynthesis protein FlhB
MFKRSKEKVRHFFFGGEQFRAEVRKQIRLLIVVTLGFTIAFTWRQTIFDLFQTAVQSFFPTANAALSSSLTSLAITLVSVVVILLASYFLQGKNANY